MNWCALFATAVAVLMPLASAAERRVPTIDDLLTLETVGGAQMSPDGSRVAYSVTKTDLKQDEFVTHIWIADAAGGRSFQLTRGDKSATGAQWSPDGEWVAFTSSRIGDRNQIFAIRPAGGEAIQLTSADTAVSRFAWSRDGRSIAFTATESREKAAKERKEHLGDFSVVRREYDYVHLWTVDVAEAMKAPAKGKARTKGTGFSVADFAWSPDGTRVAFSATTTPDMIHSSTADIYLLDLEDDQVRKLVAQPGPDNDPRWSPSGDRIVFRSAMGRAGHFAHNTRLAIVPAGGGTPRSVTDGIDESAVLVDWKPDGIYFVAFQKTPAHLFRVDPSTAAIARLWAPDDLLLSAATLSVDGRHMAFTAGSPRAMPEVFVSATDRFAPHKLTDLTAQAKEFVLGTREIVSWKSQDGTIIEGVLIKPADFDPAKRYPLLCIIHGGPTGIDRPVLLAPDARYYPADIWAARGALILKVNYRGSTGFGEKFRLLNQRNLGVGDAWDVISGVDDLVGRGWVDPKRVGAMGWSQGGYISAFLTTSSDRFRAVSVGAGISNWATYYYNTDITYFTINYLGDDPADDPEIYRKTSPMSYIRQAKTPTLIQHGEFDRRVPIPNAYELRQGLEDRSVPVELVVYKGFGHGITKPRAMRAVMQHNLDWFNHYIFGDAKPDFAKPEIPKKPTTN